MDIAILVFPGTNREKDMAMAVQTVTGKAPRMVWHKETDLGKLDLVILPGGFSYGDYLRCGAMAAHSPIMKEVLRHAARGTPLLGVCNGFQMLVETGLLPGALLRNQSLKFICKQVYLRAENNNNDFMRGFEAGQIINVPVAHGEGNYFADEDTIKTLNDQDRVAFRYCNENGQSDESAAINGSREHIAGILSADKKILGMMPHPENATQSWQANVSGLPLFTGMIGAITGA